MFEPIVVPSAILGVLVSLFTELLKRLPFWANTTDTKKILAFVLAVIAVLGYGFYAGYFQGLDFLGSLVIVLVSSYGIYRTIVEPIADRVDKVG